MKKDGNLPSFSFQLVLVLNFLKLMEAVPGVAAIVSLQVVVEGADDDLAAYVADQTAHPRRCNFR